MLQVKIIFHLHGKGIKKNAANSWFKKKLYKWVFKKTNVICLSKSLIADLANYISSTPYIVPNGIRFQQKLNHFNHSHLESVPQILFLSNYIESKGILILINALNILNQQGFKFNARLVGAPFNLSIEFLENLVLEYHLSELVAVTGPVYDDQKIEEFQRADIFVFPTYYENEAFPLVILEALQFGLPVISTFEGGIPDIVIDGESGLLVEAQNTTMLAQKIAILLADKNLRTKMGEMGYNRFMNNYTQSHFESNLVRTFRTILD
jgi:glycosyltransferase involved in cell wall biosynthesis